MHNRKQKRILLVDDEENLRVTLGDYLVYEGFEVTRADSAEEALKELAVAEPDLIILDIRMPGIGGLGFLKKIAGPDGKPRYPVLVYTAVAAMEEFFGDMAVEGFVAKPCDEAKLLVRVKQILAKRAAETEWAARATKRVLLAENDPGVATGLRQTFAAAGYEVEVTDSAAGLLERAIAVKPDVIFIKEVMPEMNGTATAQILKTMPGTRAIPIVLYDATSRLDDEHRFPRKTPSDVNVYLRTADPATLVQAAADVLRA